MVSVLTLVFAFQSSHKLAYAFGMAVTGTITITTTLFFYVAQHRWKVSRWLTFSLAGVFLTLDVLFLSANMTKLVHGAWLPLLIGVTVFTVMTTWQRGRALVTERRESEEGSLRDFVDSLHTRKPEPVRVPGTAVFLNRGKETTPLAMRANVEHNHVLHEHAVIVSIATRPVPYVPPAERMVLDELGYANDGITHVTAYFGYMDEPDVPAALALICGTAPELPVSLGDASYFLSTIDLEVGQAPGMTMWRKKRLFVATSGITADAADYFRLPRDQTVIVGSRIEV